MPRNMRSKVNASHRQQAALDSIADQVDVKMTDLLATQATCEGWGVFNKGTDTYRSYAVERLDEADVLKTDKQAITLARAHFDIDDDGHITGVKT